MSYTDSWPGLMRHNSLKKVLAFGLHKAVIDFKLTQTIDLTGLSGSKDNRSMRILIDTSNSERLIQ